MFIGDCCDKLKISGPPDREPAAMEAARHAPFPVENALELVCHGVTTSSVVLSGVTDAEAQAAANRCRELCARYIHFQQQQAGASS